MSDGNGFVWYELMTSDVTAARRFYADVIGWTIEDSGMQGMTYLLAKVDGAMVAGMMATPAEATGAPPAWLGYVGVEDVDATAGRVSDAGGMIHHPPSEIPGVGRFAVVADPQGAVFALFAADGSAPAATPMVPGHLGWHELHARDWEAAFAFYEALFGWRKTEAMDMGPMGTYQLFAAGGGDAIGGMMTNNQVPAPFWLYYITVADIDASLARITEGGGKLLHGPMEVPGGAWIVQALDPQGAAFAITGRRAAN